jgi:beta-glucosidase
VQAFPTVKFWITLNETGVYAGNSYFVGVWPPQRKNPFLFLRVLRNLVQGHRVAYDTIKEAIPDAQIGVASPIAAFEAATWLDTIFFMPVVRYFSNYWFMDKIADKQDFIGLNYYFHQRLICGMPKNKNERMSEMGWELYPSGMYQVLCELAKRYKKPIYITESGLADEHDTQRAWYMKEILKSVWQAIEEGVDVRSHLFWSLIDNFEWAVGFTKKFGLFAVDRKTFVRSPRPSAAVYAKISKDNSLSLE